MSDTQEIQDLPDASHKILLIFGRQPQAAKAYLCSSIVLLQAYQWTIACCLLEGTLVSQRPHHSPGLARINGGLRCPPKPPTLQRASVARRCPFICPLCTEEKEISLSAAGLRCARRAPDLPMHAVRACSSIGAIYPWLQPQNGEQLCLGAFCSVCSQNVRLQLHDSMLGSFGGYLSP